MVAGRKQGSINYNPADFHKYMMHALRVKTRAEVDAMSPQELRDLYLEANPPKTKNKAPKVKDETVSVFILMPNGNVKHVLGLENSASTIAKKVYTEALEYFETSEYKDSFKGKNKAPKDPLRFVSYGIAPKVRMLVED